MAEPSDADFDGLKVFHLRLNRLARPEVVLPRIMRTDFGDSNSGSELACFFEVLFGATENGGCKIPLGQFNGINYSFSPISAILQLQDKVQDQQKFAELASPAYFYVQKQDIAKVSQLPWGGSSALPSPGYAKKLARTISLRSSSSEGSGYASRDANPVSENLAAIPENEIQEQSRFGFVNGPKSESISDLVMSFPFFTLGRLCSNPTSSGVRPAITDHIVAVSLGDFSLWAIFDAWDEEWVEAEEGDEVDWVGVERYETPLKPLRSSTWGKLPGLDSKVQIAKLANNVYTHVFAPTELIDWKIAREGWSPNDIPVLFPALKSLDGPVTSLTNFLQNKESTKATP